MDLTFSSALVWWVSVVDLPVTTALFALYLKLKRDTDVTLAQMQDLLHTRHSQLRDTLTAYKLEVAKSYASVSDVREVEKRLVSHLLRIEAKLDRTTEITMTKEK